MTDDTTMSSSDDLARQKMKEMEEVKKLAEEALKKMNEQK